ncbi:glutamine amidotransferase, class I [Phenylobacterium zucineum HLK1]|uniref:Glutamine amidotransferase, class I n=1 Tax=Phenylobacterium zucineum (strain HLK1) TaxID=450851 RepID=B4R8R9_PHEZH|nr:GMP synthase [Phenylobacterium zucineum]ACG79284.1 glutamine amidotransferase, class I [Phenylobacterium zucineum HLK1]
MRPDRRRIGILKTGRPPKPAIERFGTYPEMFMRLLGADAYDWRTYAADEGEWPQSPEACEAYIVTGSACGVYDPEPWVGELMDFLRAARGRAKLVGVCFGHQAMAQAFGGEVVKSDKGWAIGAHDYQVISREAWMTPGADAVRLPASHQDQVVKAPPGAEVIAASDFTPFGALAWRDQPAISIQLHPEFEPDYAVALIEARRGRVYPDVQADAAIASYGGPDDLTHRDRARVGGWIRNFLDGRGVHAG